jgi:hypothetical protein
MSDNQEYKELHKDWVRALRSGDYMQCRGALNYNNNYYCCLGVLCEVAGLHPHHPADPNPGLVAYQMPDGKIRSTTLIPGSDPADTDGNLGLSYDDEYKLVIMNDTDGYTFNQIADWIEENIIGEKVD